MQAEGTTTRDWGGSEEMPTSIAVVGGGAKAAAIAVRARCIQLANQKRKASAPLPAPPTITVFEQKSIGADWSGAAGYTDGSQRLCTAIERDLGFPYTSKDSSIDELVLKHFSWHAFLQSERKYQRWVDEGRKPPTHHQFAAYLKWAISNSGCTVVLGEVRAIQAHQGKWRIKLRKKNERRSHLYSTIFDGLVITGPGPANRISRRGAPKNFFTGQDFWSRLSEVKHCLEKLDQEAEIAIIGAGGTAAAILAWLMRNGQRDRIIRLVADQAAFFTRGDSVFENSLFNDDIAWSELSPETRIAFTTRLNRGVVWQSVMSQLEEATALRFVEGFARSITFKKDISILVESPAKRKFHLIPGMVIDASGFDATWFSKMIEPNRFPKLPPRELRKWISSRVDRSLRIEEPKLALPNIHVPGLADLQGPGFGSLMSLGGMAQRVLMSYE